MFKSKLKSDILKSDEQINEAALDSTKHAFDKDSNSKNLKITLSGVNKNQNLKSNLDEQEISNNHSSNQQIADREMLSQFASNVISSIPQTAQRRIKNIANSLGLISESKPKSQNSYKKTEKLRTESPTLSTQTKIEDSDNLSISRQKDIDIEYVSSLIRRGEVNEIQTILNTHPKLINQLDSRGYAPLHTAVERGQNRIVELLIDLKADIQLTTGESKSTDFYGKPSIHIAIESKNITALEMIAKKYNDFDLKTNSYQLHQGKYSSSSSPTKFLLNKIRKEKNYIPNKQNLSRIFEKLSLEISDKQKNVDEDIKLYQEMLLKLLSLGFKDDIYIDIVAEGKGSISMIIPIQDFLTDSDFYDHRKYPITDEQRLRLEFTKDNMPNEENSKILDDQKNKANESFVNRLLNRSKTNFIKSKI